MPIPARRGPARQKTSKKARAARRAAQPRPQPEAQVQPRPLETPIVSGSTPRRPERTQPNRTAAMSGQPEYGYVPGDLRRIGILVGVVAAILIILSVVLR